MATTETFTATLQDGRVIRITLDRDVIAQEMVYRLRKTRQTKRATKVTMGRWGSRAAVTAEWTTPEKAAQIEAANSPETFCPMCHLSRAEGLNLCSCPRS